MPDHELQVQDILNRCFDSTTNTLQVTSAQEKGTWTPTAVYSTSQGDLAYSVQAGDYIKIGKMVTIQCFIRWTESTASGNLTLAGMPFTHSSTVRDDGSQAYLATGMTSLTDGGILTYDSANVMYIGYANAGAWVQATQANTGTNTTINFTHTYFTD